LIAELVRDMGYYVSLTPATRDGGMDVLAYRESELGRTLWLIEAKRYHEEHKVGVELVRSLYGTLCDLNASSATLVTSSTFSMDAHAFQARNPSRLTLREYTDLASWIQRYGSRKGR
jgi:restriction system protein